MAAQPPADMAEFGRVALLADIHGNFLALEAMVAALRPRAPEAWCILGDTVGYFPAGREVLGLLKDLGGICLLGNHEAMLGADDWRNGEYYRLAEQKAELPVEQLEWLRSWPQKLSIRLGAERALLVHGSPAEPLRGYVYPDGDLEKHRPEGHEMLFMGHTHRPFSRPVNGGGLCNVGSVGLPRDGSRCSTAVLFDSGGRRLEFVRVAIDAARLRKEYGRRTHPAVFQRLEN